MGKDDGLRPITPAGKREMKRNAEGLRVIAPEIDLLATSPLVRAQQTAAIVAREYDLERSIEIDALEPDSDPAALLEWLRSLSHDDSVETVAIVGHEPHLSLTATWLLSGVRDSRLDLKKGGACLLNFDDKPQSGAASLQWLLTPQQLRKVARRK